MLNKIKISNKKISIIGLGYVGLPLATEFAKKYKVVGYDVDMVRIKELKSGFDRTLELSNEQVNESIKNGTYAWQPAQEPLEFETGGNAITHSIILFHGIGQQATTYLKGDITGDGKNLWFDDYGFEDFLKKSPNLKSKIFLDDVDVASSYYSKKSPNVEVLNYEEIVGK